MCVQISHQFGLTNKVFGTPNEYADTPAEKTRFRVSTEDEEIAHKRTKQNLHCASPDHLLNELIQCEHYSTASLLRLDFLPTANFSQKLPRLIESNPCSSDQNAPPLSTDSQPNPQHQMSARSKRRTSYHYTTQSSLTAAKKDAPPGQNREKTQTHLAPPPLPAAELNTELPNTSSLAIRGADPDLPTFPPDDPARLWPAPPPAIGALLPPGLSP